MGRVLEVKSLGVCLLERGCMYSQIKSNTVSAWTHLDVILDTMLLLNLELKQETSNVYVFLFVLICSSTMAIFGSCTQWAILYHWWLWCWHLASWYFSGSNDYQLKSILRNYVKHKETAYLINMSTLLIIIVFHSHLSENCTAWGTTSTWICLPPSSCEHCPSSSKMLCWTPTSHRRG